MELRATPSRVAHKAQQQAIVIVAADHGREGDPLPGFGAAGVFVFDLPRATLQAARSAEVKKKAFYTSTGELEAFIVEPGEYRLSAITDDHQVYYFQGWNGSAKTELSFTVKPDEIVYLGHWRTARAATELPSLTIKINEDLEAVRQLLVKKFPDSSQQMISRLMVRLPRAPDYLIAVKYVDGR